MAFIKKKFCNHINNHINFILSITVICSCIKLILLNVLKLKSFCVSLAGNKIPSLV